MSFGFGFGFPKRLTSGGGLSPRLYLDFIGTGSLPSTVTFSRGTNATLTDSNGRIAWAPHNLLLNSEDFEAAGWVKTNATVTANNTVAPDGTTTADAFVDVNGGTYAELRQVPPAFISGNTYTYSLYAKIGTRRYLYMSLGTRFPAAAEAFFDLQTGTVKSRGAGATGATISAVGNGFYLCSITATANSTGNGETYIYHTNAAGDSVFYTGTGTGTIFIWGAQLNVANAPVNLLTWSQALATSPWAGQSGFAPVVTNNAGTAPDGTNTATSIVFSGQYQNQRQSVVATPGVTYTFSFWARVITGNTSLSFFHENSATGVSTNVSITTSWARYSVTVLGPSSGGSINFGIQDRNASGFGEIYIWGAQVNTGSTALPYVATTSSIYLPPAYNSTTPKNLLGFTQEPENAAWTKSNSYVQQNLLTWSQDFDNAAWVRNFATVTANTTIAPDGTTTADLIYPSSTGANRGVYQGGLTILTSATPKTFSFYIKPSGFSWFYTFDAASGLQRVFFNVTAGTVGTTAAGHTASIENVGNGWYRCVVTTSVAYSSTLLAFGIADADNTTTATASGTNGFFIWGAQLVQGSTAGDYTQTTSAAAPTRYLNWDGTLTGRKLVEDTAVSVHWVGQSSTTQAIVYADSVYLKAGERTFALVYHNESGAGRVFDLSNGVLGGTAGLGTPVSSNIVSVGGGWYRCSILVNATAASNSFRVYTMQNSTTYNYTGDGTSGIYVSDFQLSNSASVDPYVYNPQAAAASAAYYGPRFDYNPTGTPVLSGVELITNGDFSNGSTGWTLGTGWTVGSGVATHTGVTAGYISQAPRTTIGKTYRITVTITATDGRALQLVGAFWSPGATIGSTVGTFTVIATALSDTIWLYANTAGTTISIDNVSVQEVTGYTATANGLLIEEARTNLLTYSEQFDNAAWTKTGVGAPTANSATAPDGNNTADTITANAGIAFHGLYESTATTGGATYALSMYVKKGTQRFVSLLLQGSAGHYVAAVFDLDGGGTTATQTSVGAISGTLTSTSQVNVGNGWFRLILVGSQAQATTVSAFQMCGAATGNTFTVDGTVVTFNAAGTETNFLWGSQLELGAFSTSYIPTVASQVTRNADSASMLGDNFYTWYNPNQGTLYTEGGGLQVIGRLAGISDGTTSNRIINYLSGATQLAGLISAGGAAQANPTVTVVSAASANKLAQGYLVNNVNIAANGTLGTLDTSAIIPAVTLMRIGADEAGTGNFLNGTIRRIGYYNTRLPDSTLTALTT